MPCTRPPNGGAVWYPSPCAHRRRVKANARGQRGTVPYCEISVSHEPPVVAGGDKASVTISLVAGRSGPATLSASGMRTLPTGDREHLIWMTRAITAGDRVSLVSRSAGASVQPAHSEASGPADLEVLERELESYAANVHASSEPRSTDIHLQSRRPISFKIVLPEGRVVDALLGDYEQLQLVATFQLGLKIGTIEVASLTVTERGYTRHNRWLTYETILDERVSIEVAL